MPDSAVWGPIAGGITGSVAGVTGGTTGSAAVGTVVSAAGFASGSAHGAAGSATGSASGVTASSGAGGSTTGAALSVESPNVIGRWAVIRLRYFDPKAGLWTALIAIFRGLVAFLVAFFNGRNSIHLVKRFCITRSQVCPVVDLGSGLIKSVKIIFHG